MRKRNNSTMECDKICVDKYNLAMLLDMGINSANKLGEDAHAVVKIGKRKLFNVAKVRAFINSLSE